MRGFYLRAARGVVDTEIVRGIHKFTNAIIVMIAVDIIIVVTVSS